MQPHRFDLVVQSPSQCVRLDRHVLAAEPHIAAQPLDLFLFGQYVNDRLAAFRVHFGRIGGVQSADVPCVLNHCRLKPQTQSQIGHVVFTSIADAGNFAFHPPHAEAAGNDDSVNPGQMLGSGLIGDIGGLNPFDIDLAAQVNAGVFQRIKD